MLLISWIKRNKLSTILLVILLYIIYKSMFGFSLLSARPNVRTMMGEGSMGTGPAYDMIEAPMMQSAGQSKIMLPPPVEEGIAPAPGVANRLVIQESNLSLLVKDVVDARKKIVGFAETNGGYMVTSHVSNPQDAPKSTVTIRVPAARLEEALEFFRSLSVKVVSENLMGRDVTDQYVDIAARIELLEKTKARFETILAEAREISDITNLNQQIIYTQSQIDDLKGQQESFAKNAELAKLTIHLSTDELALPYAPTEVFRPSVIFKLAVRSLLDDLRNIAEFAIWATVYSVIWVPLVLIGYFLYKRFHRKVT